MSENKNITLTLPNIPGWVLALIGAILLLIAGNAGLGGTPPDATPTEPPPAPTATVAPGDTPQPTATETATQPVATEYPTPNGQQRIINPSFEGEYTQVDYPLYNGETSNAAEIKVAPGWLPYYCNAPYTPEDCEMKTPEFTYADRKMAAPHSEGGRVHSGERAMKWFCTYDTCIGGVYQTIATIPGELCTVEAWVMTWFSYDENPASESATSDQRGASVWRIKVNLAGRNFGFLEENLSSWEFGYGSGHYDNYVRIYFEFQANARQTTIFIENERNLPAQYQDSYLDDVTVNCVMPSSFFPNTDPAGR
jgi:hypothetical protein